MRNSDMPLQHLPAGYSPPPHCLRDKVILVTGAGQGLGRAAALAFARHGATVILTGRQLARLEAVYDEILAAGLPTPYLFPLDLGQAAEAEFNAMAEGIYQQIGRLDGLLHNAAQFDRLATLESHTMAEFEHTLRVNLIAPFALTKACLPLLQRAPDAAVVFTSSSAGQGARAYWGAHGVSKRALEHLAGTWSLELEKYPQLRLNVIVPGPVQSPQRKKSHPGEIHENLPTADSLMPLYLYLMSAGSAAPRGGCWSGQPAAN